VIVFAAGSTAQASGSPRGILSVSLAIPPISTAPGDGAQPAAVPCRPGLGRANRTDLCWPGYWTIPVYDQNGNPIGEIQFTTVQYIHLNVIGRKFTEDFNIVSVTETGIVPSYVLLSLSASCGSPCRATVHFPQNFIAVGTSGTISYYDAIGYGKVHSTRTSYKFDFTVPPGWRSLGPIRSTTPIAYRCDDKVSVLRNGKLTGQGAGCVYPAVTPALYTMAKLPDIAKNIRNIQNKGPGHYGRYGSGHPLHRLVDQAKQDMNYRAVCARRITGPPPKKGLSCDEYPFKSTYEGGTALSKNNRGWSWVPVSEQNAQGAYVKNFYYANRILDHDPFWVVV
jgi:Deoxyribonuclease NucA/NucB